MANRWPPTPVNRSWAPRWAFFADDDPHALGQEEPGPGMPVTSPAQAPGQASRSAS